MLANRPTVDKNIESHPYRHHAQVLCLAHAGSTGSHRAAHEIDRLFCPTLMERVLGFMDRYHPSPRGQR